MPSCLTLGFLSFLQRSFFVLGRSSFLLVGCFAFLLCIISSSYVSAPIPKVHDEFSYLLMADTFYHGRLANPPHPKHEYFETFHILQTPTYISKYPPAQGAIMALGRLLGGHPIVGVWLAMALMCASISWMLQIWIAPRWAFVCGVLIIFHPSVGVASYWAHSYWGGAVAAFASALFWGALWRTFRKPSLKHVSVMMCGLGILVNARPFEGALLFLSALGVFLFWASLSGGLLFFLGILKKIFFPSFVAGCLILLSMGYYNHSTTGNFSRMPHTEYERKFSTTNLFVWERSKEALPRHPDMKNPYRDPLLNFQGEWSFSKKAQAVFLAQKKVLLSTELFIVLFLCGGIFLFLKKRRQAVLFFVILFFSAGRMLCNYDQPHYWAPLLPIYCVLFAEGVIALKLLMRLSNLLLRGAYCVAVGLLLLLSIEQFGRALERQKWTNEHSWSRSREDLTRFIDKNYSKALILVSYHPQHSVHVEWVYNNADIDRSNVVFARDMGAEKNQEILDYFMDRNIFFLKVGENGWPEHFFLHRNALEK